VALSAPQLVGPDREDEHDAADDVLQHGGQASLAEIDARAAHRHAFSEQEIALRRAFRQAPVGADDALPRDVVRASENEADEARRARIDVAIGSYEPFRDRAHPFNDARLARFPFASASILH
jgi:hypothetical protein